MTMHRRAILVLIATTTVAVVPLRGPSALAQQPPRYPVDPETQRAIGARLLPADELKTQLDAGAKVLVIEARERGKFDETLPGAINIPLPELEAHLKTLPKDTHLVFTCGTGRASSQAAKLAEELGFKSSAFCPVNTWKGRGYRPESRKQE
jgi:rhodanese-related sulfurtransferase